MAMLPTCIIYESRLSRNFRTAKIPSFPSRVCYRRHDAFHADRRRFGFTIFHC